MSLFARFVSFVAGLLPAPRVIYSLDGETPYLSRYYIFGAPKMPDGSSPFDRHGNPKKEAVWDGRGGLYLHRFHRSDEEPELHNHPFEQSASLVLVGGYFEQRLVGNEVVRRELRPGNVNVIGHDTFHRVELSNGEAWSLFAVTRKTQSWGFFDVRFREYTKHRDFFSRRSKEKRAATHCPKCDALYLPEEKPEGYALRMPSTLLSRSCRACYRRERQDQLEERFAKAAKVSLSDFAAERGDRGLVTEESDGVVLFPDDDLDGNAMVLRDGTRFLWAATTYRPGVDLARECNESWLSDHHENANDHVDDLKLEAAQKLVDEALAGVVSYEEQTPTLAVVLPPLEAAS